MRRLVAVIAALTVALGAAIPTSADEVRVRTPCQLLPIADQPGAVARTYLVTGGPWTAELGVDSVTVGCSIQFGSVPANGDIATAEFTTPGLVGVLPPSPVTVGTVDALYLCTTVIYEYFWPFFWNYLAYEACDPI